MLHLYVCMCVFLSSRKKELHTYFQHLDHLRWASPVPPNMQCLWLSRWLKLFLQLSSWCVYPTRPVLTDFHRFEWSFPHKLNCQYLKTLLSPDSLSKLVNILISHSSSNTALCNLKPSLYRRGYYLVGLFLHPLSSNSIDIFIFSTVAVTQVF